MILKFLHGLIMLRLNIYQVFLDNITDEKGIMYQEISQETMTLKKNSYAIIIHLKLMIIFYAVNTFLGETMQLSRTHFTNSTFLSIIITINFISEF